MNYLNSLESSLNTLFTNKYFLYTIVFLSATSNLGYLLANNINAVGFFIIIGIIMVNFSKNMAVVLTVCLVATNFLVATKTREGMDNPLSKEGDEDEDGIEGFTQEDDEDEDLVEGNTGMGDSVPDKKKKEEGDAPPGGTPQLDYGASATNAYKDLDNILDPAAIDKLTKETMELMEQQQTLYTSMQSMAPLLSQANTLLKGFDMTKLQSLASGTTELSGGESADAVAGVDMNQLKSLAADMEQLKGTTDKKEGFAGMGLSKMGVSSLFSQILRLH